MTLTLVIELCNLPVGDPSIIYEMCKRGTLMITIMLGDQRAVLVLLNLQFCKNFTLSPSSFIQVVFVTIQRINEFLFLSLLVVTPVPFRYILFYFFQPRKKW
jgi:hypothetical protein